MAQSLLAVHFRILSLGSLQLWTVNVCQLFWNMSLYYNQVSIKKIRQNAEIFMHTGIIVHKGDMSTWVKS